MQSPAIAEGDDCRIKIKRIRCPQEYSCKNLSPIGPQMHQLIKASPPTCSSHLLANGELFFFFPLPIQARFRYLVGRRGVRSCAADWSAVGFPHVQWQRLGLDISAPGRNQSIEGTGQFTGARPLPIRCHSAGPCLEWPNLSRPLLHCPPVLVVQPRASTAALRQGS